MWSSVRSFPSFSFLPHSKQRPPYSSRILFCSSLRALPRNVYGPYPGRLGFTDANGSPDPHDYNQHGGIYLHLARNGQSFLNFGNGFEFAIVDEDYGTEPTGIRNHVNVPMEKVVRDNSDHLYPEFNTHIPDSPLPEDPMRFSRFGRFQQVFEASLVDRQNNLCKLPAYVDLYFPNDHTGGAF